MRRSSADGRGQGRMSDCGSPGKPKWLRIFTNPEGKMYNRETPDELYGVKGHRRGVIAVSGVAPPESDPADYLTTAGDCWRYGQLYGAYSGRGTSRRAPVRRTAVLAYTTHSVFFDFRSHAWNGAGSARSANCPKHSSLSSLKAWRNKASNFPRNSLLKTRTGRKNFGRQGIHRAPSEWIERIRKAAAFGGPLKSDGNVGLSDVLNDVPPQEAPV